MRSSTTSQIPIIKNISKSTPPRNTHSLRIHLDTNNIKPARPNRLDSIHIRKLLTKHTPSLPHPVTIGIPCFRKRLDDFTKPIRRPAVEDDFRTAGIGYIGMQVVSGESPQKSEERRVSLCGAVLEGGYEVDSFLGIGRVAGLWDC